MTSLERTLLLDLSKQLKHHLPRYFPGVKIQAHFKGKKKIDIEWGETFTYYDLASLTKTVLTTPLIMQAVSKGQLKLTDQAHDLLPWYGKPGVTVRSLLTQTSGLPWWRPYYLKYQSPHRQVKRWEELKTFLSRARLRPTGRSVYSDLGFMMLGMIAEEVHGASLAEQWQGLSSRLGLDSLHFNNNNVRKYAKTLYAPTERCRRRGMVLQGQVHDDNCFALGGVSSHAGLFGNIDDVSKFGLKIFRDGYLKPNGNALADQQTFLKFAGRAVSKRVGDWGLGWWKPSPHGVMSTAGSKFSRQSVGGLGFTGTSIWYDPKVDLLVTVLSNRVHPSRRNRRITELRPKLHDLIYKRLVK